MDPTRASYARYWEPSMIQTLGLSTIAGVVATFATYPIDYIKTVIQYRSEGIGLRGERFKAWTLGYNPFYIVRQMHANGGGLSQFYGGFEAHLIGRVSYLAIRNIIYKVIYDYKKPVKPSNDLTNGQKMVISGFAGGLAAYVTTPFTLISIRQILDSQTKPEWRRNYGSTSSALATLGNQKFKGSFANVLRHVILNVSLTAPYDYLHQSLYLRFGDFSFVKPLALTLAAMVSAVITLPFDTARTRLMYAHSHPERNRLNYTGIFSVFAQSLMYEKSAFALWAGYWTYLASTLLYAFLTVGITSGATDSLKRAHGLKQWQI